MTATSESLSSSPAFAWKRSLLLTALEASGAAIQVINDDELILLSSAASQRSRRRGG